MAILNVIIQLKFTLAAKTCQHQTETFSVHPLTICLLSTESVTSQSSQRDHQRQNSGLNNFPSCTVQYQRNIDECQCKPGFSDVNWHGGGRCDQATDHASNEVQQNVLLKIPYTQPQTHTTTLEYQYLTDTHTTIHTLFYQSSLTATISALHQCQYRPLRCCGFETKQRINYLFQVLKVP